MIRAWFFGVACWVALGALGLGGDASARLAGADGLDVGRVSAPAEHEPEVVESRPLALSALAERSGGRADPAGGRPLTLLRGLALFAWIDARRPCPADTRVVSRTSVSARRRVDLRREVFRTRPGRRVGSFDAAAHAPS